MLLLLAFFFQIELKIKIFKNKKCFKKNNFGKLVCIYI